MKSRSVKAFKKDGAEGEKRPHYPIKTLNYFEYLKYPVCCQTQLCQFVQRWRWGHPEAKAIYKKDYHYEYKMVQKVIGKNPDHDGIAHGITFLNIYLERSAQGATYLPGSKYAKRLYDLGVTGDGILTELGAIYMLSRNFHTPVKDHRHLKYLLGSKFIQFILGAGKVKGTENRDVGDSP